MTYPAVATAILFLSGVFALIFAASAPPDDYDGEDE